MTDELPETITIRETVLSRIHGHGSISGGSHMDNQERLVVGFGISDAAGVRDVEGLAEGDTFEFAGATWQVTRIYEPIKRPDIHGFAGGGGSVATLTRVS